MTRTASRLRAPGRAARTARHRPPGAHPWASEAVEDNGFVLVTLDLAGRHVRSDVEMPRLGALNLQDQDVVVVVVRDEPGGLRWRDVGVHLRREVQLHLERSGQCPDRARRIARRRPRRWCSRRQSHCGRSRHRECHRPAGNCPGLFCLFRVPAATLPARGETAREAPRPSRVQARGHRRSGRW